jgi:hypothetical protein
LKDNAARNQCHREDASREAHVAEIPTIATLAPHCLPEGRVAMQVSIL